MRSEGSDTEHPELERQIIETVEAGNVLDETQQHDEAFANLDLAYSYGKKERFKAARGTLCNMIRSIIGLELAS